MSRTVLLGLDGATFSVLDPLMRSGVMPFLREFTASGARAPLRSIVPALTPPAWTSMVTGRRPGAHGIFDFFRKESAGSPQIRFLTSRDVACEPIWSRIGAEGRRATVLNFPLTFPPSPIDGHMVPGGWMPWRQLPLGCHPQDLYDRLQQLPGFNPRELAMDMSHEEKAVEGCRRDEYAEWIALHIRREKQWFGVLEHLIHEDPTDLIAVLFDGVDKLQHLCWRFIDPALAVKLTSPWEREVHEQCLAYFRTIDDLMSRIVALAGAESTVVVASDHGFGPQERTFFVNAWLAEQGHLSWTDGAGPRPAEGRTLGMAHLARHVYQLDWARTRAYAPLPSGNGIHIVRVGPETPGGVRPEEYEPFRQCMIRELRALKDSQSGKPVVSRVWTREEIFDGPFQELAPDLTLELQDGGLISILASDDVVTPRLDPTGTHRPEGIFIARGPNIRPGVQLDTLSILDVAPLLHYTLNTALPDDLDGRLPVAAIDPEALRRRPPRRSSSPEAPAMAAAPEAVLDTEAEAEILKRLQALGYVE